MDVKDLRTDPALSERNDGSKYSQGGVALQYNRNKSYQDIGANPLAKTEGALVRPCAVIGPDRIVPPATATDAYLKKGTVEPWPSTDNEYRRPPDYPHRLGQTPARNISPRQTFQENMQRINVPPTYNAVRHSDSANFSHVQDRSVSKNAKPNMAPEAKYCDVPYSMNALANEPKNVIDSEMYMSSVNSQLTRNAPHVWPPGSVNVNAGRTYSANEPYQYPQYTSCAGQRPPVLGPVARPLRTIQEDPAYVYPDHYYRDAIGRLKPYPAMKERCPQTRYEHVGNYGGQFHPPPPAQPIKYDIPKPSQSHPYPMFPHFKYLDNRVPDLTLEGYQRSTTHQPHYNLPLRTQVIHPTYTQMHGTPQKLQPYPADGSVKAIPPNKLHYDNSSKMYFDYESARSKPYPTADNYYVNEMNRFHSLKNQMVIPNFSPVGMRAMPSQQYYTKDNPYMKPFEYMPTFRNFEPHLTGNPVLRHAPQFSPNTLAISPTDSSTSNDTSQTHGTSQEDCGYVSQSSSTSVRSIDSSIYRLPHEYYKRHDFRYSPIVGSSHTLAKTDLNSKDSKQKQIDVRQFLQMWNEGEEENNAENSNSNSKEIIIQTGSSETGPLPKHANTEDQLYVLGLVNVPSEELGKYEHIEKISKLPENIKGYNNLELFSRFEEAMESCNTAGFKTVPIEYPSPLKDNSAKLLGETLQRPVSPLDVEAKISQSVIHKDVGCNFEIKPCSPKMLNVAMAAPAQNILGERVIEKVSNPLSKSVKSPLAMKSDEISSCHTVIRHDNNFTMTDNPSCKMVRSPYSSTTSSTNMDSVKSNYTLQDLEINSGVCLASLPRLDNEIELNFPEVNQQFINANKKDGTPIANNCHQSNLQEDSSLPDSKGDKIDSDKSKMMHTEYDKTFSKLSKYRKMKASVTDSSENNSKVIRTDSVIIKNPENIENKMLDNNLNSPINLSSQSIHWYNSPHELNENKDNEIALDFSLNKSGTDLPILETEKDDLIKPFDINDSHISRQNILTTDANDSYHQENAYINDIIANSKTADELLTTYTSNVPCGQNFSNLSCENLVLPDPAAISVTECIQSDPKTISKIQNSHEVDNKLDVQSYEVIKSTCVDVINDANTPISVSYHSDSLAFENTNLETKKVDTEQYLNSDKDKAHIVKLHETCKNILSKNYPESVTNNTSENTLLPTNNLDTDKDNLENNNQYSNCENNTSENTLLPTNNLDIDKDNLENNNQYSNCENNTTENTLLPTNNLDIDKDNLENNNQFSNCENSTTPLCETASNETEHQFFGVKEYSEANKSALLTNSEIDNNFEHDEISASLEKLFRESNEEPSLLKNCNYSTVISVSKSAIKNFSRLSKELHSPWIQKLLTHSEGLCSHNELPEKSFSKSAYVSKTYTTKTNKTDSEFFKKDLAQGGELGDRETIGTMKHINPKQSIKDFTLSNSTQLETNVNNQGPNNIIDIKPNVDVFDTKENASTKTLIERLGIRNVSELCIEKTFLNNIKSIKKRKSKAEADTSKRKIKNRKSHTSNLEKNSSIWGSRYLTNVISKLNIKNCITQLDANESKTINQTNRADDPESVIKKDIIVVSSKTMSNSISTKGQITEDIESENNLIANSKIMPNCISNIEQITEAIKSEKDFIANSTNVPDCISDKGHISEEIDSEKDLIANSNMPDCMSEERQITEKIESEKVLVASESFKSGLPDCTLNVKTPQESCNELIAKNVSNDISDDIASPEQQLCDDSSREITFKDLNKDTHEKTITCNSYTGDILTVTNQSQIPPESLSKTVSYHFTEHQEQKTYDEVKMKVTMNNNVAVDNNSNITGIFQDDRNLSDKLLDSAVNTCTDHESEKLKTKILEQVIEYCGEDTGTIPDSFNNTPTMFDVDVTDHSKSQPDVLSVDNIVSEHPITCQSEEHLVDERKNGDDTFVKSGESESFFNHDVECQNNQGSCSSIRNISKDCIEQQNKQTLLENITDMPLSDVRQISESSADNLKVVCLEEKVVQKCLNEYNEGSLGNCTENPTQINFAGDHLENQCISSTLDNEFIVCVHDDIRYEDQHNTNSEIVCTSDDTSQSKTRLNNNVRSNFENISKYLADGQNTCSLNNSDTTNQNNQEENLHVNSLPEDLKDHFKYDKDKNETDFREEKHPVVSLPENLINRFIFDKDENKIEDPDENHPSNSLPENSNDRVKYNKCEYKIETPLVTNSENEKAGSTDIYSCTKEDEIKYASNEHSKCSLEDSMNTNDNHIKPEPDDTKEKNCMRNILTSKNSKGLLTESIEEFESKRELDIVSQGNNSLTDSHSQQTMLSNDDFNASDHKCCEDKKVSLFDPVATNVVDIEDNSETSTQESPVKRKLSLKRSYSDSALNTFKKRDTPYKRLIDNTPMWPPKRQKIEFDNAEQHTIDETFCNFIQNRRNSISTYYNSENVSFCILIDNDCILTEENEDKICFAELSEDCITEVNNEDVDDNVSEVACDRVENEIDFPESEMLSYGGEKPIQESWLDDVACVETVVSEDVIDDADNYASEFSRDVTVSNDFDESGIFTSDASEMTHEINVINEEIVHDNISEFENACISPRSDEKILLYDEEPQYIVHYDSLYSGQCMEKILSETYRKSSPSPTLNYTESILLPDDNTDSKLPEDKENIFVKNGPAHNFENGADHNIPDTDTVGDNFSKSICVNETSCSILSDTLPESSLDNLFSYKKDDNNVSYNTTSSSSPEVSSTTFEEKNSSILLKITNLNGSRVSEINEVNLNRPRCKFTESKDYSNSHGSFPKRPLITKAAQKYIPPLKESICDLKVKLPLPQQRLLKLKQLKLSRSEPKVVKQASLTIPKKQKPKPNFEDVLKSIDEVQIKLHKQNNKKSKNTVPKVVIKKSVNGSHYTSSSSDKDKFNPDLTGRKWQPWVFLERNRFIDNMAMKNKTTAIFSHRQNMYVLAEKFKKYKSVSNCNAKFVISHPKTSESSKGQLKYTIKLKHFK